MPRRVMALTAVAMLTGVAGWVLWVRRVAAQDRAMQNVLNAGTACVTDSPAAGVLVALAIGLGGFVLAFSVGVRRRVVWVWAGAVALAVVQVAAFLLAYAPDSSQESGGEFSATYCSSG